jgi:hypothetical protein
MTGIGSERSVATTRRTLMRGAAWSVPVVAVAAQAPAFAASPCDPQTYKIDWGTTTYTPPSSLTASPNTGTATVSGSAGGSSMSVTFASTLAGGATRYDGNLTVPTTTNIGGLGATERGLAVRTGNTALTALVNQTITITFGRAISNLSFYIVDLDRDANFWDRVTCTPVPTSSSTRASTVAGVGDAGLEVAGSGPFRYTGGTTGIDDTSNAGNVQLVYAGGSSFTSLQLNYWNAGTPGPQGILLSDFTFTARGC